MYWQVKAFFGIIILSIIGGAGYWCWSTFGDKIMSTSTEVAGENQVNTAALVQLETASKGSVIKYGFGY